MLRLLFVKTADFFLAVFDMTTMGHPCILRLETSRYIANNIYISREGERGRVWDGVGTCRSKGETKLHYYEADSLRGRTPRRCWHEHVQGSTEYICTHRFIILDYTTSIVQKLNHTNNFVPRLILKTLECPNSRCLYVNSWLVNSVKTGHLHQQDVINSSQSGCQSVLSV